MKLDEIIPFGRTMREYELMFALSPDDFGKRILGCADGPASFNAEMTQQGFHVTSCDPIYQFSGQQIKCRFDGIIDSVIEQVESTPSHWVWGFHNSPSCLRKTRERAISLFLADYDRRDARPRYVTASLPHLPFSDGDFDLALCSHFLFLYSDMLSAVFHENAVAELARVAKETRIFPLVNLDLKRSQHIDRVIRHAASLGLNVRVEQVPYEFQRGGNEMLRIRHSTF